MKLQYICAQPATLYYVWQVEVMLNNFRDVGINLNQVDIVCWKQTEQIPEEWNKLANNYAARFFFYDDKRESTFYISSIRPNILKQHFQRFPELAEGAIFYHDCDIVFTKQMIFGPFLYDNKWYGSDTRFYIGYEYIMSKGEDVIDLMCDIVKIDKELVKDNEFNSIGAQYLMKGIDWKFWENVENDCEMLFRKVTDLNIQKRLENPKYHELQIWCADMWAVLWNGWKLGYESIMHKDFDFAWATSSPDNWDTCNIYHNAGVVSPDDGMFYKSMYVNKLPYGEKLELDPKKCSYKYWQEIEKTAKKTVL
jgi:hypothetical protein